MSHDLLAGLMTGPDLMKKHFCYDDALADLLHLIDSEYCTPDCLYANPETYPTCTCRCEGIYHGEARFTRPQHGRIRGNRGPGRPLTLFEERSDWLRVEIINRDNGNWDVAIVIDGTYTDAATVTQAEIARYFTDWLREELAAAGIHQPQEDQP